MKLILVLTLAVSALAQETAPPGEMTAAEKLFHETMNNVTLVGFFTVGDSTELREDRYVIERVSKVKDDLWKFEARVQYNKKDVRISLPVPVKFAGDTPVITLTRQAVAGLGTFDTRLVIYKGAYAGTWGGGQHGGKMFGNIVKNQAAPQP